MEIKCNQCGFASNGPDTLLGKKLKCPKCGAEFVAGQECAFTIVEENTQSAKPLKDIVEKPIGKIGDLEVTNKRVRGSIMKKFMIGNTTHTQRVEIDVLLNLITGITVCEVKDPLVVPRLFASIVGFVGMLLGIALSSAFISVLFIVLFFVGVVLLASSKDKIHLVLSISGVDHFIPYETSQMEEAKEKCKMLKDAKREYERLARI